MTRKKVEIAFITNDANRKASYKKRKKGLFKKAEELSTLCGIDVCAILYSPFDYEPEVWPSSPPDKVHSLISKFKMLPELDQTRRMVNQESYTEKRVRKAQAQLKIQQKDNREKEVNLLMYNCLAGDQSVENFCLDDLNEMGSIINRRLKEIIRKMGIMKRQIHQRQRVSLEKMNGGSSANYNNQGTSSSSMVAAADQMPQKEKQQYGTILLDINEKPEGASSFQY